MRIQILSTISLNQLLPRVVGHLPTFFRLGNCESQLSLKAQQRVFNHCVRYSHLISKESVECRFTHRSSFNAQWRGTGSVLSMPRSYCKFSLYYSPVWRGLCCRCNEVADTHKWSLQTHTLQWCQYSTSNVAAVRFMCNCRHSIGLADWSD